MELKTVKQEDIEKIKNDLEIIKSILIRKDPEGELSDWAKEELAKARAEPRENYISHEEVKRMVLGDDASD